MNRISLSKSLAYSIFIWLSIDTVSGQVSQKIGGNPGTIDPKAVLELESTTKGFLLPRMTSAQMTAITNPTSGMIVFCTDCGVASDGELRISYNGVWQTYKGNVTGNITGTAANVTGTVAVANGGTGSTTSTGALTNLGAAPIASPTFTGTVTSPIYASTPQALTDAATISWNPANGLNASVTLGGNRTLSFASTPAVGSYGTLIVTQDATGNRTITLPSTLTNKILGSSSTTTISLSTAANAKDILNFYYDGTNCYWNVGQGYGTAAAAVITNLATGVSGTLPVANGGSGSTTLTGYVKGNGTSAMTANATIPVADVTGAAPIASPTFTGTPVAPTAVAGTNTTQVATTEFVTGAIATATIPDATTTAKGKIQLAGDLSGTAALPVVAANAITTAKILDANVTDAKIATVSGSKVTGNITGSAANVTGTVAIANGGTGSTTQNFVDLTTNQTIAGAKTFSSNGSFKGQTIGTGNATGGSNLAVGSGALNATSTGHRNTAIGSSSMQNYSGTGFDNNTSVGYANLVGMTTGSGNTSVGAESMMSLTTGMYNTSIGNQSLINTTGNSNVGVGQGAGATITTGSNNTIIGTSANVATNNLSNSTALGNGAVVEASNSVQLGNTSVTNVKTSGTLTAGAVTYPNTHGTTGQILSTTGSGTLTWVAPSASSLSGTVAVANGGTGATTATGALTNLGAAPIASPTFTGTVTSPIYASTPQALIDAATISWNPANGLNASVTLGGNRTLSFASTPAVGSYGTLIVTQDATGNRTITLPSTLTNKILGSSSTTTISLSTAANAKDILNFYYDGTNCYWNVGQGYGTAAAAVITNLATGVSGTLPVANGGTGAATLTGIVKGNGTGAMTAAVAGTDYVLPTGNISGTAANITGTTNSTLTTLSALSLPYTQITGAPSMSGYLTSSTGVTSLSGGTTGLTPSAATSGAITLGGTLSLANGGTGQTSISGVKGILGLTSTSVAIGASSGTTSQGTGAIGIGNGTGQTNQGSQSVAIGYVAGNSNQGANSVAIGSNAAQSGQGTQSVAIGIAANSSANNSIAIGGFASAGHTNATALGFQAVTTANNTIQLGADGVSVAGSTAITNVKTSGTLTAGTVTYPNTHNSSAGQVLTVNASGTASWAAASAGIPYTGATGAVNLGAYNLTVNELTIGKGNGSLSENTVVGKGSMSSVTGNNNTSMGSQSMPNLTSGGGNTAIGSAAGYSLGTGSNNIILGYNANMSSNPSNSIVIGTGIDVTTSNTIQLGNTSSTSLKTSAKLTSGTVTYPNTHNNTAGQVLTTDASGVASWTSPSATSMSGVLPIANGGTGLSTAPANGQIDIGNGTGFTRATLTAGTAITITNTAGTITIAAAVRPTTDQATATAAQTSFTLTSAPLNAKVWMFINGVRTNNNAYSISGTTVTYTPANNNSYVIVAGDRIQFDYCY